MLIWLSYGCSHNPNPPAMDWGAARWIVAYLIGMGVISYFGDFGPGGIIGGIGVFKHVLVQGGNNDLGLGGEPARCPPRSRSDLLLGGRDPAAGREGRRLRA